MQRLVIVTVLAAWTALGAVRTWRQTTGTPRSPAWARQLAPLRQAPLPAGTAVAMLVSMAGADIEAVKPVLMEAAWQRPDLRWALLQSWPSGPPAEALVAIGTPSTPPGWRETWRQGIVAIYERAQR